MAKQDTEDEVILSYHDSCLRSSDVNLLKGPYWLNDIIIAFYYEYLTHEYKEDNEELLFINPSMIQLLKMVPDSSDAFLNMLDVKNHNFLFLPVNDSTETQTIGGTHWTLLVYSHIDDMCYHYDSSRSNGARNETAYDLAVILMRYFNKNSHNVDRYIEMPCPLQTNSYDCGIHILCLTDILSRHITRTLSVKDCDFGAIPEMVKFKRYQLLNLIQTLKSTHPTNK